MRRSFWLWLPLWTFVIAPLRLPKVSADEMNTEAGPPMLGLTVSGGVSLGAFEAGYLYYLFETLKLNRGLTDPRIFTGASAGSANALLSLMSNCSGRQPRPDLSLFYQTWVPVGLRQLFRPTQVTSRGLFSPAPLEKALDGVGKAWEKGLDESCDVTLGLSTTRVTAAKVELIKDRVTLARTEAKFVVRVRGRGQGKTPLLSNYVGERELLQRPRLPVESDGSISFESLKRVLMASGAFPLAFPPVGVPHCNTAPVAPGEAMPQCTPDTAEVRLFMDGGVFDNQPLRLAVQLAQHGLLGEGSDRHWSDLPTQEQRKLPSDALFVYVDPAVEVLPTVDADEGPPDEGSTLPYLLYLFEQLVESSRSKELQVLLEDDPDVTKQITATHSYFMPLSDPLYSFFGFFETDFRVHDFYLGMHSAHRWFAEVAETLGEGTPVTYPETLYAAGSDSVARSWAPFQCMRVAFDGKGDKNICKAVSPSVRAGIQTSLDRIYARCSEMASHANALGQAIPATTHSHCRRAFLGKAPPLLPGMSQHGSFRFRKGETAMEHELRRLAAHGFVFRDLRVPADHADQANRYVAQRIGAMLNSLSKHQEQGVFRAVLPIASRIASQALTYVPPYTTWHVIMGRGIEAGYSGTSSRSRANWLRGSLALDLDGLLSLVSTGSSSALKLSGLAGAEFELTPLSSWQLQTRIGLRAGYGFSTRDTFGTEGCDDGISCSRATTQGYVALVVYQLLRIQLAFSVLPPMRGLDWTYAIHPRLGIELDRP